MECLSSRLILDKGYRVYYGLDADDVILLAGGTKATQEADIKLAEKRWRAHNAQED